MGRGGKVFPKIVLACLAVIVAVVAAGGWLFWKRPLTVDAWMSRRALAGAGLDERVMDSPSGRLTYWEGGAGPTLVLLHGAGDQAGAWARTVTRLVRSHRLVIPDLPGHWGSEPESGPLGVGTVRDGVAALIEARCADEPPVVVGNSLGAWVAMLIALDSPASTAKVVCVNGGALRVENPTVNLFPQNRDEARKTMDALMGPATPPLPGFVLDDVVRRARCGPLPRLAQTAAEMEGYLLAGRLGEITVPVELVWGDADELMTLDYARRMLEELPRARLHPVAGCGHVPQRECPDRFLAALQEALTDAPEPEPEADTESGAEL